MNYFSLYVTVPNLEDARTLARTLVEERLAACVNVLDGITSLYRWEGQVEEAQEVALIVKISAEQAETAMQRIRTLHSYDCPCITAWPIVAGDPDYLEWVNAQTREQIAIKPTSQDP